MAFSSEEIAEFFDEESGVHEREVTQAKSWAYWNRAGRWTWSIPRTLGTVSCVHCRGEFGHRYGLQSHLGRRTSNCYGLPAVFRFHRSSRELVRRRAAKPR